MKKLDWYILRKYLTTFFFIMAMLITVTMVLDLSEKIEDLIEESATVWGTISQYYLNYIPYMGSLLAPFFIFLSVIIFTSQLAYRSEFIAMLSSGISYRRLMLPYLIGAIILGGGLFVGNHWLIPKANKKRLVFERTYIYVPKFNPSLHVHKQDDANTFLYVENYSSQDSVGYRFTMEIMNEGELKYKLAADKLSWSVEQNSWRVDNFNERYYEEDGERLEKGKTKFITLKTMPDEIVSRTSKKEELSTPELTAEIQKLIKAGTDNYKYFQIEKHRRSASAFSVIILTFMGMAIASRKIRGGMGFHIVAGITLSALYEFTGKFSTTLTINGDFPAVLGAWLPNIVFAALALYLIRNAQK